MAVLKSPSKRAHLIVLKKMGLSDRAVAREIGDIDHTTVNRIWRSHLKGNDIFKPKHSSGRPRKLRLSDTHWACLLLTRGLSKTAADLQRQYFPNVSVETLRRYLRELDFKVYRRRRVPYLSRKTRRRRLKWGRVFSSWDKVDWLHVAFSDESKFVIFNAGGPIIYWKKRRSPPKPWHVKQVIKHGGGNVMVWGYITRFGPGRLHRLTGRMNTAKYTQALTTAYLGSLPTFGLRSSDLIFQHDNDPKHSSRGTTKWLLDHKIRVLPWPSSSPDMNPIEHVWDYLDRAVRSRPVLPRNQDELWDALQEEWYKIPMDFIAKLYDSMTDPIDALIKAKGGHTQY